MNQMKDTLEYKYKTEDRGVGDKAVLVIHTLRKSNKGMNEWMRKIVE